MPYQYKVLAKDGTYVYTNINQPGAISANPSGNVLGLNAQPPKTGGVWAFTGTGPGEMTNVPSGSFFSGSSADAAAANNTSDPSYMAQNIPQSNAQSNAVPIARPDSSMQTILNLENTVAGLIQKHPIASAGAVALGLSGLGYLSHSVAANHKAKISRHMKKHRIKKGRTMMRA